MGTSTSVDSTLLWCAGPCSKEREGELNTRRRQEETQQQEPSVGSVVPLRLTAQLVQKRIIPFLREHRTHLVQLPRDETQALATPAIDLIQSRRL